MSEVTEALLREVADLRRRVAHLETGEYVGRAGGLRAGNHAPVVVGGVERARFTDGGRLGLGTAVPAYLVSLSGGDLGWHTVNPMIRWPGNSLFLQNVGYSHSVVTIRPGGSALGTTFARLDMHRASAADPPTYTQTVQLHTQGASYFTGGPLGVGISSPVSKFHVYEDTAATATDAGLTIEQDGSGDAVVQFLLTALQRWVIGIDNSDSDRLKISGSADLDTAAVMTFINNGGIYFGANAAQPIRAPYTTPFFPNAGDAVFSRTGATTWVQCGRLLHGGVSALTRNLPAAPAGHVWRYYVRLCWSDNCTDAGMSSRIRVLRTSDSAVVLAETVLPYRWATAGYWDSILLGPLNALTGHWRVEVRVTDATYTMWVHNIDFIAELDSA